MGAQDFLSGLPVIGGLFDDSQEQAMQQLAQNQALWKGLQTPTFNPYKPVAYTPEMAKATQISSDPAIRNQQQGVLMKLAGLSDTGLSDADTAGFERARELGDQSENEGNAAALQNAESRGIGGSGLEFAMREKANQDGAQRAQDAGLQQAATAARQRAMYNEAYGNALSGVRGQDFQQNGANADILNNFARYNTGNQNQANLYNTQQQNFGQQYNNDLTQRGYEDQVQKLGGETGSNTAAANGYAAENASRTSNRNSNTGLLEDAFGFGG
jgi:hypothetical protein